MPTACSRIFNYYCSSPRAFRVSETAFCVARRGVRGENGFRNFECSPLAKKNYNLERC